MERKTKVIAITLSVAFALILIVGALFLFTDVFTKAPVQTTKTPTLTIEIPQKLSASESEYFSLDVLISDLGEAIYPAASFCIGFDPAYLEFIEVKEGNVFISNDSENVPKKLPDWSYNATAANASGQINLMYLDLTGGKYAFSKDLLAEEDNVVFRLSFRLRGSARAGDIYYLTVENAVFAASDETQSLATSKDTLRTKHGKIIVGE